MSTFVKDAMTTQVIWVEQDTPFAAIAAALREYRVSAFPVLDEAGRVIGVVSESDLLAKLALGGGEDGSPGMIGGILHQHGSTFAGLADDGQVASRLRANHVHDAGASASEQLPQKPSLQRRLTGHARSERGALRMAFCTTWVRCEPAGQRPIGLISRSR